MIYERKIKKIATIVSTLLHEIPVEERKENISRILDLLRNDIVSSNQHSDKITKTVADKKQQQIERAAKKQRRQKYICELAGQVFTYTDNRFGPPVSFTVTADGKFDTPIGIFDVPSLAVGQQWDRSGIVKSPNRVIFPWYAKNEAGQTIGECIELLDEKSTQLQHKPTENAILIESSEGKNSRYDIVKNAARRKLRKQHITKLAGETFTARSYGCSVSFTVTADGQYDTPIGIISSPSMAVMNQWEHILGPKAKGNYTVDGWYARNDQGKSLDERIDEVAANNP